MQELKEGMLLIDVLRKKNLSGLSEAFAKDIIEYLTSENIARLRQEEGELLYQYASCCKGTIVEVGTGFSGGTVILGLADCENSNRVYSVDIIHVSLDLIKQFGLQCNLIQQDSHACGLHWDKGLVDMLLIDGDHHRRHMHTDMEVWSKHLKKGGYMLIHDCVPKWKLQELKEQNKLNENGIVKKRTKNMFLNIHRAVVEFLLEHREFKEIEQVKKLRVLQKT